MGTTVTLILIVVAMVFFVKRSGKKEKLKQEQFEKLLSDFENSMEQRNIDEIKSTGRILVNDLNAGPKTLNQVYQSLLDVLKDHPELKQFTLEMGRVKYSKFRPDKKPTT